MAVAASFAVDVAAGRAATKVSPGEKVAFPAGKTYDIDWAPVAGATSAAIDAAALVLTPIAQESPPATMAPTLRSSPARYELVFAGGARLRRLTLAGLGSDATTITEKGDLDRAGARLVVLAPDGPNGQMIPRFCVPPMPGKDFAAPRLAGASLAGGVLGLPDSPFTKIGIALVKNDTEDPGAFQGVAMALGDVTVVPVVLPTDVAIVGPDGQPVWQQPGELLPEHGAQTVDLRVALEAALKARVAKGQAPQVSVTVRGSQGTVGVRQTAPRGALLRAFPGVVRVELAGEPRPLPLPDPPLAPSPPSSFTADITVNYRGTRLWPEASDALPAADLPIAGTIVGAAPVLRALPVATAGAAASDLPLAAAGLYGRAPEACELAVWIADAARARSRSSGATEKAAQLPVTVARLEPSPTSQLTWLTFPAAAPSSPSPSPTALAARANTGRFLWAAAGTIPLVRLAVRDPDPGGRPLLAGGRPLLAVNLAKASAHVVAGASDAAAAFGAGAPPLLDSELFLGVDIADLTLRYDR